MSKIKSTIAAIRQLFRQRSYFKQLLGYYIVVSCVAFLFFSIILLSSMQKQYLNELASVNEQNVQQAKAFNEASLYDINYYCYNLLDSNASLKKLLYSSDFDTLTAINSREIYDTIRNISSMITSCDLINYSTGTVLTQTNRVSLENYADQDLLAYLETLTPSKSSVCWVPRISRQDSSSEGKAVISLILYTNKRGVMVVNLDYDAYVSQLNLSDQTDAFEMILVNQTGQVFASSDRSLFGQDYSNEELYLEVQAQSASQGSFSWTSNGTQHTVSYTKNGIMGITCISILSANGLFLHNEMIGSTLRLNVIYLLVTMLLSVCASLITYRPVNKLRLTVSSRQKARPNDSENANDFAYLESVYTELLNQSANASQKNKLYENEKEAQALYALMTNNNTQPYPDTSSLENQFDFLYYCAIVIHVTPVLNDQPSEQMDPSLIRFMIHNVASELAAPAVTLKNISPVNGPVILLANFEGSKNADFPDILKKTQQFFSELGLFTLSIGIGSTVAELDALSLSYDTARTALACGMYKATNCICFYDDLTLTPIAEQVYPYDRDAAIIAALKNQSIPDATEGIRVFLESISTYNYEQIYRCLLHLQTAIQRFEYNNHLTVSADKSESFHYGRPFPETVLTEPEWNALLSERCCEDIRVLAEIRMHSKSKDSLIVQVQQIVADNIYNVNLSVTMIAEQVNLSVNYLRNLYKENTGESLSTYISSQKLSMICDLLTGSDLSIQEISDKLGFATKNYFFTFFKKHMGMTPSQYRKEHGNNSSQE